MSYGNQSYLRFSLEESVWFQRGQEVDELISMSLDPNIAIHESEQYVTIKGSLQLYGEYQREVEDIIEEDDGLFSNPKMVQSVEVREEGLHLFSHHFPVEITIPKNRIQSIDEIDVTVESFDYAFPERSCLRLSADLNITGLYGEQQHEFSYEEELDDDFVEIEVEDTPDYEAAFRDSALQVEEEETGSTITSPFARPVLEDELDIYQPFEAEAKKTPQDEQNQPSQFVTHAESSRPPELTNEEILLQNEKQVEDEISELLSAALRTKEEQVEVMPEVNPVNSEVTPINTEVSPVSNEVNPEQVLEGAEPIKSQNEVSPAQPIEEVQSVKAKQEMKVQIEALMENHIHINEDESSSSSSSPQVKKKHKKKQTMTITEFLARKDEESHTRLKICIVQKGDSLETLSERYDVTVPFLQKVNNLQINQDVYEGQVLYIPIAQRQN